MISLNRGNNDDLRGAINSFDSNQETILQGNGNTGKRSIPETTEASHLAALEKVASSWARLKSSMSDVANDGSATIGRMETILSDSASLKSDLEAAQDLYGTETIITK